MLGLKLIHGSKRGYGTHNTDLCIIRNIVDSAREGLNLLSISMFVQVTLIKHCNQICWSNTLSWIRRSVPGLAYNCTDRQNKGKSLHSSMPTMAWNKQKTSVQPPSRIFISFLWKSISTWHPAMVAYLNESNWIRHWLGTSKATDAVKQCR